MNQTLSMALLAAGVVLILFGISAADSIHSDVSNFFTGSPTEKSIWMLVVGIVLLVVGLGGTLIGRGHKPA